MTKDFSDKELSELQAQIDSRPLDTDALKSAFDPLLGMAETRNLSHRLNCAVAQETAQNPSSAVWPIAASFAGALAIGVATTWAVLSPKADWRLEVAHYQALYVTDTLNLITTDDTRLNAEFTRAGDALGLTLNPTAFAKIEGLKLRRAQVLGYKGASLVQIAFTLPDGTPFAFCILRQNGDASVPEQSELVGLASTSWQTATHGFLAIGDMDKAMNKALALQLMQAI